MEPDRPTAHFTPWRNWMNDPNGLLYHEGEYHFFFQYNRHGIEPGQSSWGHAISTDLVEWIELPVAIPNTEEEYVLSGSAVVDHDNVSGLGEPDRPAMVALYTGFHPVTKLQQQAVAFSLDRGRTWQRYAGNPVLDIGSTEFRDPKLLRRDEGFVMAIVMAEDRTIRLYRTGNLLDWELSAEVGGFGYVEGVWECPDIVSVPIEGTDERAWVLLLSVQAGGPVGGSGMQYAVVDYDGETFTVLQEARWLDHGADFYAAVSYTDAPGAPVIHGWMNNWLYAEHTPGSLFRGSATLPRRLSLRRRDGSLHLVQKPVVAEGHASVTTELSVTGVAILPEQPRAYHLAAELEFGTSVRMGFDVRVGDGERTRILCDRAAATVAVDRRTSGVAIHDGFAALHEARLPATDLIRLDIYVDASSTEVLAADGEVALTDQIFPSPTSTGLAVFAEGGTAVVRRLAVSPLL